MTSSGHEDGVQVQVRVLDQEEPPAGWPELMAGDPHAEYTHGEHWARSVAASFTGARPAWLTVHLDERLVGGVSVLLRPGYRNLPFGLGKVRRVDSQLDGTAGGPLVAGDLPDTLQDQVFIALVHALFQQRGGGFATVAMALGHGQEARFGPLMLQEKAWSRRENPTAAVSLEGGIDAFESDRMTMNKRNERNRGLKRGAEVFATDDPDLLARYHPIYEKASGHWGVRPTSLELLKSLLADPAGQVFFTCVRLDGEVIGGHLCLHWKDRVFAWNGVSDPRYAKSHFPGTLCMWGDAVEACRRGARWLDLGGSGKVDSLVGFKKYFGAELQTRGYYTNSALPLRMVMGAARRLRPGAAGPGSRWHDRNSGGGAS